MTNLKKLLVVLLIAVVMIGVSNVVLATEADENNVTFIPDEEGNNTANNTNTPDTNSLFNNNNTNTNTNTNTNRTNNTTNNTNSSQYNNSNLPKAGSSDGITIMVVVAVFGISALYAYKKIRDYNIK